MRIARNPAAEVQPRASQAVPYRRVAELIGLVHAAELPASDLSPKARHLALDYARPHRLA